MAESTNPPNVVTVSGKLMRIKTREGVSYNTVVTPAADEFSRPQYVQVVSTNGPIGQKGDRVTCQARLAGYERSFELRDGSAGHAVEMRVELLQES